MQSQKLPNLMKDEKYGSAEAIMALPAARTVTMSTAVNHMGYRYPELHPGCTGCGACLYVCPDFVFEVFRFEQPVVTEVTEAAR